MREEARMTTKMKSVTEGGDQAWVKLRAHMTLVMEKRLLKKQMKDTEKQVRAVEEKLTKLS